MSIQPISSNNKSPELYSYNSSLMTDYASGLGTITVYSATQFAVNQILCIGEFGSQNSEIVKTHASTSPSGNTITLSSNLTKSHGKDTPVYIYLFDQIEFSHADTLTGSKSILGTLQTLDPSQDTSLYLDSVNTTGYYFTRYKNSITGIFSDYSDGIPYSGLPANTVGYAIDTAMNELNARFSEILTFDMLLGFSRQMLRLVRGKLKAWSKYQEYDYVVGNLSGGVRSFAMPDTIYDKNSRRSVLNVRVGTKQPLSWVDKEEYLSIVGESKYTEVATEPVIGATSLVLDDTKDLDDAGSADVFVNGTKYTITYTTNTRSTNTLSGIPASGDGSIAYAFPVNSATWQNIVEGEPEYFNVSDGNLYLWPMISTEFEGRNVFMDFYTDIETIDSQMDLILGSKFDMLIPYLKFKIRTITENNGKEDLKDPSYLEFRELLTDSIKNDASAERESFRPRSRSVRFVRDNSPHYPNVY